MVLNSLSFCLSVKLLISPSYLNEILAGYSNLGFCNISTGVQSSCLLTRLLPSTRRVVLPGGMEILDEPPNVMLRARISEPTERESKSTTVMQGQEGSLSLAR